MFKGSYVALVTPFTDGEVDESSLRNLVSKQIDSGTEGIVSLGTTGESPTVSESEYQRVLEIVVSEASGRIPVIAGVGSNNPVQSIRLAQFAEHAGVDGLLAAAGFYNRPSQEGLYQHFKFLHDGSSLPIVIYNIPPRTIVDVLPDTMARLADLPRIVGVKDATAQLSRISVERQKISRSFSYFSGEDMTALAYNSMGGHGCISVTANVTPKLCLQMHSACRSGDYALALKLHEKLVPLHSALFSEPSPSGVKYALSLLGLCTDEVRLPIVPVSAEGKKAIESELVRLECI